MISWNTLHGYYRRLERIRIFLSHYDDLSIPNRPSRGKVEYAAIRFERDLDLLEDKLTAEKLEADLQKKKQC